MELDRYISLILRIGSGHLLPVIRNATYRTVILKWALLCGCVYIMCCQWKDFQWSILHWNFTCSHCILVCFVFYLFSLYWHCENKKNFRLIKNIMRLKKELSFLLLYLEKKNWLIFILTFVVILQMIVCLKTNSINIFTRCFNKCMSLKSTLFWYCRCSVNMLHIFAIFWNI